MRAAIALLLVASVPARADTVSEVIRNVHEAKEVIDLLVDIAYAADDFRELQYLPSQIWGELMADPVTAALVENAAAEYRGGVLRTSLDAAATSDLDAPGAIAASGEAAWDLPLCRVIGARASGLAAYNDGETFGSYTLGGTACLPLPANTLQISYTRRENIRTSVVGRGVTFEGRRDDDLVDIMLRFYRWRGRENWIEAVPADIHISIASRDSEIPASYDDIRLPLVAWRRKGKGIAGLDQTYRFLQIHFVTEHDDDSIGGRSTTGMTISPLTLEGVHLTDELALSVDLGFTHGFVDLEMQQLFRHYRTYLDASLDAVLAPFAGRLQVTHTMVPGYGGQLVDEDRATARLEVGQREYAARVEGFAGRVHVLRLGNSEKKPIAGGAGDLAWTLVPHLNVLARVEAARSLAAGLDTDPVSTRWDLRATVGIAAHYDHSW